MGAVVSMSMKSSRRISRISQHLKPAPTASRKDQYKDQTVVVTGGARGIGFGIAERFAEEGVKHVALLDMGEEDLKKAVADLTKKGCDVSYAVANVMDWDAVKAAIDGVVTKTGRIDVLVQCAGITGKTAIKSHEVDGADFDKVMAINVKGLFHGVKAAVPYMLEKNYGRIVNIASVSGKEGNAGMLAYSTSKAAVIGMTKVMGKEYAETGITVNCIAPAVVRTEMVAALPEEQVKYMTDKIPMKRCGAIEELAGLAAYIAS